MQKTFAALALLAALALPGLDAGPAAAKQMPYSCALPGDSQVVYRLAWVEPGRSMRSGAVVVGGNHLAGELPTDAKAVGLAYATLKKKYGVGAVVNLRSEASEDQASAQALGMRYLHLPIADGVAPSPAQVQRFFTFVDDAKARKTVVLWHCAGGIGRTGVLAGMLRVRSGWRTEDAAREMFAMGLNYDQAVEHLPALNGFAQALGRPAWYPADWPHGKRSPHDYAAVARAVAKGR